LTLSGAPLITIITVVFNGQQFIEETILSVKNQKYSNIEYILIDGGSTDGTLDIIRRYESAIKHWVSEEDQGIYDAMNKGIALASGQWINFMNCGDQFATNNVVSDLVKECALDADFLMGDVFIQNGKDSKIVKVHAHAKYAMPTCHQAIFYRAKIIKDFLFDTKFKVGGDFNQYVRITSAYSEIRISFFHGIIANITAGGFSAQNESILQMDYFNTIRIYNGIFSAYIFILDRRMKYWIRNLLKKIVLWK
jgi:glycosyltransferase involved in cell wall biosynthesis